MAPWIRGVASISSGYPSAMSISRSRTANAVDYSAVVVLGAAILFAVWKAQGTQSRRLPVGIVAALSLYLTLRQAFVRHDNGHVVQFYAIVIALALVLAPVIGARRAFGILAATALELPKLFHNHAQLTFALLGGVLTGIAAYLSIRFLMKFFENGQRLTLFGILFSTQ